MAHDQHPASLTVGIDLDGVLGNHLVDVLPRIRTRLGIDLRLEHISEFRLSLGASDLGQEILLALKDPNYISEMPVHPGAVQLVRQLSNQHKVILITARPVETRAATERWLQAHGFAFDSIINAEGSKSIYGANVLIDDYTGNIVDFVSKTGGIGVLVDRPWNQHDRAHLDDWFAAKRAFVADELSEVAHRLDALIETSARDRSSEIASADA